MMSSIKILWLYPSVLNLHGDRGNIMALQRIGGMMGLPVEIVRVESPGDELPLDDCCLIYAGAGQVRDMENIARSLSSDRDRLDSCISRGGYILATGSSGCLLAHHTRRADGSVIPGLGLLPMICTERETVYGDDIWFDTASGIEIIGNQIQVVDTQLEQGAEVFGHLLYGYGNNGKEDEGCRRGNIIFTNTLGPLLVKNPRFTQDLLERLAVMAGCEGYHMLNSADMDYEDKSAELIRAFIKKKMA